MPKNIDAAMSRICDRLMNMASNVINEIGYMLDEADYAADTAARDDIKAFADEIRTEYKRSATAIWNAANQWGEHFDTLCSGDTGDSKDAKQPDQEPDGNTDDTDD